MTQLNNKNNKRKTEKKFALWAKHQNDTLIV